MAHSVETNLPCEDGQQTTRPEFQPISEIGVFGVSDKER
jgi:hypothetical protein